MNNGKCSRKPAFGRTVERTAVQAFMTLRHGLQFQRAKPRYVVRDKISLRVSEQNLEESITFVQAKFLGLLGMISNRANEKVREIGVRKVLVFIYANVARANTFVDHADNPATIAPATVMVTDGRSRSQSRCNDPYMKHALREDVEVLFQIVTTWCLITEHFV